MFSIIIPSLNNLNYLKLCVDSLKKNSSFNHEIIIHVNIGADGTIEYLKKNNIQFTHTTYNAGIPEGVNKAAKIAQTKFIVYAHDDFYFLPGWDKAFLNEIKLMPDNLYYFSGTMIQNGQVNLDCGDNLTNFNENKFDEIILDTVNKKLVKMKLNIQLENLTQYIKFWHTIW
mgnify:CR=1 FL=1